LLSTTTNHIAATLLATSLAVVVLLSTATSAATSADDKHLSVYSSVAVYTVPVVERSGLEYVGLLELMEPLGRVSSQSQGSHWTLRYNAVDAEFVAGRTRARIHGRDLDLPGPFLIENSRGLIPVSSINEVLVRFLGAAVNFHESARRLFIGGAGTEVSFQFDANIPSRLVLNFTAPVNPSISTEPGKLRMVFKRDPLVSPLVSPGSQSISFDNKVITQASYSESHGDAELDIAATEPLMASFSNNRKTITVATVPTGTAPNGNAGAAGSSGGQNQPLPAVANSSPVPRRTVVVVDAAHGGDERGAALTDTIEEKNVTLGFARLLRHELELRNFAVILLRDGDTVLTLDQRASAANVTRGGLYITLHAVSQVNGSGVYTALLPVEGASNGAFHAWNAAQAPALAVSKIVAAAIVGEMQKREFPVRASSASLRPLNNVTMPAVAMELAPGENGVADLISANYQQRAASALADAVASVRDRLGVQQ
jgi:N-acetylmuramoyl-L-alanine amidase